MSFELWYRALARDLLACGEKVNTGHWQALKDVPQTKTVELRSTILRYPIPETLDALADDVKPNLPWADLHFEERVGGEPVNPPPSHVHWPWARHNAQHQEDEKFSHTYPERMWPRQAGWDEEYLSTQTDPRDGREGIRYRYGDLNDVLDLLTREPYTRQAYLPIWFPEDTGAVEGQRVPCTLGYHFMLRNSQLHCFYPIRSCDLIRHFRDDVYLACRLVQWIIEQMPKEPVEPKAGYASEAEEVTVEAWRNVKPGELTFHAHSFHVFEGDIPKLRREYG